MAQPPLRNLILLPAVANDPLFSDPLLRDPALHDPLFDSGSPIVLGLGDNPQDFAALFVRHRWSFALHARRFLSDQRDIDEVVQEGFLRLFQILPELETELQALAYCRRTITNLCIDRYRADLRRPRLIELHNMSLHLIIDEDENDPLIQAEDAAAVRDALAQLSPLHRSALIRREIQEQSLTQIAEEMDIPLAQVKHLLFRARGSLRRLLVGTQVEPGVDLELAMVLAAHPTRSSAAQRPQSG